jgi:hypothetical protein
LKDSIHIFPTKRGWIIKPGNEIVKVDRSYGGTRRIDTISDCNASSTKGDGATDGDYSSFLFGSSIISRP